MRRRIAASVSKTRGGQDPCRRGRPRMPVERFPGHHLAGPGPVERAPPVPFPVRSLVLGGRALRLGEERSWGSSSSMAGASAERAAPSWASASSPRTWYTSARARRSGNKHHTPRTPRPRLDRGRVEPGRSGRAQRSRRRRIRRPAHVLPRRYEPGGPRAGRRWCRVPVGLAGHPGVQLDPHRRPAPIANGTMVWSTRSSIAARSSQCGRSHTSPTRAGKTPQVSHRCWPNARVPQPAHSYAVIGLRGHLRAGTTVTLGRAWCRHHHTVSRQASEQSRTRPAAEKACHTAGGGPSRRRLATARPEWRTGGRDRHRSRRWGLAGIVALSSCHGIHLVGGMSRATVSFLVRPRARSRSVADRRQPLPAVAHSQRPEPRFGSS